MSRFLGKIHYIMFDKINYLNNLVKKLENLTKKEVYLNKIESGELEDLIDTDNIHGWLQERVSRVEDNLAKVLNELAQQNLLEKAYQISFEFGKSENFKGNAEEAFQYMSDKFLDGMPCDMANMPVESNHKSFSWIQRLDVHEKYYIYGQNVDVYYKVRENWLNGLLNKTNLSYFIDGKLNTIS